MTFNAPDSFFTLPIQCPGTMTWQWPSAVFLCSKVSRGILPIWGTNKRSGGWEEVLASFPWLDSPLPKVTVSLRWPSLWSTFSKFFYYSRSFYFSGLRILPDLITSGTTSLNFFPHVSYPYLWKWTFYSTHLNLPHFGLSSVSWLLLTVTASEIIGQKSESSRGTESECNQRRPGEFCFTGMEKIGNLISRVMNKKES